MTAWPSPIAIRRSVSLPAVFAAILYVIILAGSLRLVWACFKARSWDDLCGCILIAVVVLSFAARLIVV